MCNNLKYAPLVTIVIPVYNGARYLAQCIDSALAQTYPYIEIIVVNDGSTDEGKSREIALSFGDKIRYFEKDNGGVSTALNRAIAEMKGEWFSWLSHDDLYYPQKITEQISFINNQYNLYQQFNYEKCLVLCDSDYIDDNGNQIKLPTKSSIVNNQTGIDIIINNVKRYSLCGIAFLIPRKAFIDVGVFDERLRRYSDNDMWYRLILNGYNLYYIDKILVRNRMHADQITYSTMNQQMEEAIIVYHRVFEKLKLNTKMNSFTNFILLAFHMDNRRYKVLPYEAYSYAVKLSGTQLTWIYIMPLRLYSLIYGNFKNLFRKLYIQLYITRAPKKVLPFD